MKLFSKASEYAIVAMMYVVARDPDQNFSPTDICNEADIPEPFVRKALGELTKARILKATRGPGGGYRLVRDLGDITLLDIVLAVDGETAFQYCPLGRQCDVQVAGGLRACKTCKLLEPKCGLGHMCALHKMWKQTRQMIVHDLDTTSLKDVQDRLKTRKASA